MHSSATERKIIIQKELESVLNLIDEPERFYTKLVKIFEKLASLDISTIKRGRSESYFSYRVSLPDLRYIAKLLIKEGKKQPDAMRRLLRFIWTKNIRETRLLNALILAEISLDEDTVVTMVDRYLEQIGDWEICDQLATNVSAKVLLKNPLLFDYLKCWARSANKWKRRAAAVSLVPLCHYGRKGEERSFELLEILMKDTDKDVQKGVSWLLRELSKKRPAETYKFITAWLEKEDQATRQIIKDAYKKLPSPYHSQIKKWLQE
jgi:3-methyladenine DNA glycosylase AlkD